MSFTIRLSQDLTAAEAGATVPLSIEVTNKGEEVDRYEMQVEGVDPEWTASPEPVFNVGAAETHSQKVFFKPPRASESLAGNYPFVVRVRSLNSGDSRTVQGVLQIKPFHHLSLEISPKKGYISPMRQLNTFTVTVINLGNTEHTLQLSGSDPEEECAYDFAQDQVTVGPGQQKEVEVTVNATGGGVIASSRLFGFQVAARSIQNPNIMTSAQAQLERRPLLSPGTLLTIVVLVAAFFLWYAVRPQKPTIMLSVGSSAITQGETVPIQWKTEHANSVRLEIRRNVPDSPQPPEIQENLQAIGSTTILATKEDMITVTAYAVGDSGTTAAKPVNITVRPAPVVNPPRITKFRASSREIKLGDPVLFTFEYSSDVDHLVLSPLSSQQIQAPAKQIQVVPSQEGVFEYQLIAYNSKGTSAQSKPITIKVVKVSDAKIQEFSAHPPLIQEPDTKTLVTWNVTNAALVQLKDGTGGEPRTVDANNQAGIEIVTDKAVTLTLMATDAKGVMTKRTLEIRYKPLPPIPPLDTTTTGTTTGPPHTTTGGG
jgi:hypothetical protein